MRLVLDTNIFIVGFIELGAEKETPETEILRDLLYKEKTLLLSTEIEEQILRIILRIKNKDFAGLIRHMLWSDYKIEYVNISGKDYPKNFKELIPRKDLDIFLAAYFGNADAFITNDKEFLKRAKECAPDFQCVNAEEFVHQ